MSFLGNNNAIWLQIKLESSRLTLIYEFSFNPYKDGGSLFGYYKMKLINSVLAHSPG